MQALILAAGMGTRLKELTRNKPKCMVEVNGEAMIDRLLGILETMFLNKIIIVDGYKGDLLEEHIRSLNIKTPLKYVRNHVFDKTNNIYSLSLAGAELVEDDTLLIESDLVFTPKLLRELAEIKKPTVAVVDKYEEWMDGTVVTLGKDDIIRHFIPKKDISEHENEVLYKTVNIYKLSKEYSKQLLVPLTDVYIKLFGANDYYEQVFRLISEVKNDTMFAYVCQKGSWYEADTQDDLREIERRIASRELNIQE